MASERAGQLKAAGRALRQWMLAAALAALAASSAPAALGSASTVEDRLEAYRAGALALNAESMSRGWVRYDEVVALSYGAVGLAPGIARAKADWRRALGEERFITDYSNLSQQVAVFEIEPIRNAELNSHLVGLYFPRGHVIKLARTADPFVILHESGHALQRAALKRRQIDSSSNAAWSNLSRSADLRTLDERALGRLRYLVSQDEFEVRLQDLNRFSAVALDGEPILDVRGAARALLALRMPLRFEELRDAMEALGAPLDRADFDSMAERGAATPAAVTAVFDDARELVMLRALAVDLDPELWPALLRKILAEAPGHY